MIGSDGFITLEALRWLAENSPYSMILPLPFVGKEQSLWLSIADEEVLDSFVKRGIASVWRGSTFLIRERTRPHRPYSWFSYARAKGG